MILSILAVALCSALLVGVASLFGSFIRTVQDSASDYMGEVVFISPIGDLPEYGQFMQRLREHEDIEAAAAFSTGHGLLLIDKGNVRAVQIWGIDIEDYSSVVSFRDKLIVQPDENKPLSFVPDDNSKPDALFGFAGIALLDKPDRVTDEYDIEKVKGYVGKRVVLTTGTAGDEKPRVIPLTLSNVVRTGVYDFDESFIYLPMEEFAERVFGGTAGVARIGIRPAAGKDTEQVISTVRRIWPEFAEETLGWSDFLISSAKVLTAVEMQKDLIGEYVKQMGVLMLIFGIVSFGVVLLIFCIFYMIVTTKRKDIAIIKSCGAGPVDVAMIFIVFALVVGIVGSASGVLAGYAVIANVNTLERAASALLGVKLWKSSSYMISSIPNDMDWTAAGWVTLAAAAASVLGAVAPAISAARVRPVKLLRYE